MYYIGHYKKTKKFFFFIIFNDKQMMETSHFDIVDGPDCYFDVSLYLFHNENNKQTEKKKTFKFCI